MRGPGLPITSEVRQSASYLPTVHLLTRPPSHQPTMEEDNIVSNLSDKSRSLRKTSVKKRLETELKKVNKRRKEKICKKPRLNKYQRKVANAKERERMKRMNDEYERLKKVVPMEQLNSEDGKDKKVTLICTSYGSQLRTARIEILEFTFNWVSKYLKFPRLDPKNLNSSHGRF